MMPQAVFPFKLNKTAVITIHRGFWECDFLLSSIFRLCYVGE